MRTEPLPTVDTPSLVIDEDGIAWLTFHDPERKVNVLSEAVMRRLTERLEAAAVAAGAGRARALVVRSANDDVFIAGADVAAIEGIDDPEAGRKAARFGQAVFQDLERLPIPTVAAIHGTCLGGGLELALACRYRVASDSRRTLLGLPEVQLGILPAWGGTTRLPRLIGLQAALELLLTGDRIRAAKAHRMGLVDEVFPAALFDAKVREFTAGRVRAPVATGRSPRFLQRLLEDTAPGRRLVLRSARKRVLSRTGGHYPAPLKILEVVGRSLGRSPEKALDLEASALGELIVSTVCKNLIHVYRLREAARKGDGVAGRAHARQVERVAVVGAGVMGGGIAQLASYHGIPVRLKDIRHEAVAAALKHARGLFDRAVERRRMESPDAMRAMERISGGLGYDGFGTADLVVEAVMERMDVKRSVLAEVEAHVAERCILASNTSSLSIDGMAEALHRPERFCGMHFFNPVHRMPLVEVVRGDRTGDDAVATVHALARRLGKVPVVVKDGPGFLVNRILGPYLNEAGWLLADGASVQDVDAAAKDFGMPMGPLRLVDEVGIDVIRHAGEVLHEAFGDRLAPAPPLVALAETGRLGRKGGLGLYRYEGKSEDVDPAIYEALGSTVPARRGDLDPRDIRARLVLALINEAALALGDGIVLRAGDVDLAMIMGTGFPPFRGGLLRYADQLHPRAVVTRLEEYRESVGPRFQPAPVLVDLASRDISFYAEFP